MKIIIKNMKTMKLYSGEISYDKLKEFVLKEFPKQIEHDLRYEDSEGDKIVLSSQEDLQVMKELLKGKQYVKLTYNRIESSSESEEKGKRQKKSQKKNQEKKLKKENKKQIQEQKKAETEGEKKVQIKEEKNEEVKEQNKKFDFKQYKNMQKRFFKKAVQNTIHTSSSESQSKDKTEEKEPKIENQTDRKINRRCHKLAKIFEGKPEIYTEFVKENIELKFWECANLYSEKNNIPMEEKLKTKVANKIQKLSEFFNKTSEHFTQILKENPNIHFRQILKMLKERGLEAFGEDDNKGKCHKGQWRKHCHRERSHKHSEEKTQHVLTRRCIKVSKVFGGNAEDYLQFVKKTIDMNMPDVISQYGKVNNIDLAQKLKDKTQEKLTKLAFFFNKPAQNYRQIVLENPTVHFRGILRILKEKGLEDYGDKNFKQMKEKLWEQKKNQSVEKNDKQEKKESKPKSLKKDKKDKSQNKKVEQKVEQKEIEVVEIKENKEKSKEKKNKQVKGIVNQMKDIFGPDREKQYLKFVEEKIELGKQQIINQWIQKVSQ